MTDILILTGAEGEDEAVRQALALREDGAQQTSGSDPAAHWIAPHTATEANHENPDSEDGIRH